MLLFRTHHLIGGCLALLTLCSIRAQNQPISLDSCLRLAVANNLDIQRSKLQVKQRAVDKTAAYLALLPDVNGNISFANNLGRSIDPTTNLFINTNSQAISSWGSSNLRIFQGFRLLNTIKKSKVDLKAQDAALAAQISLLTRNVGTQYLAVLLNKELVTNAQYQLQSANQQVLRLEKLVEAQTRPAVDLLDLRAQAANAQVRLIQANNNLNTSTLTLKQLLLLPYEEEILLDTAIVHSSTYEPITQSVAEIYARALPLDPRINQAQYNEQSARLAWRIAQSSLYPSLNLDAFVRSNYSSAARQIENVGLRTVTGGAFLDNNPTQGVTLLVPNIRALPVGSFLEESTRQFRENLTTSFRLNLAIPIFNRGATRAQITQSKLRRNQQQINLEQARNNLRIEVEQAYNDATAAYSLYEAAQLKAQAAQAAFQATEQRYNLQAVSLVDYQISINNYYQARSEELNAKYRLLFRKKLLEFYQGLSFS